MLNRLLLLPFILLLGCSDPVEETSNSSLQTSTAVEKDDTEELTQLTKAVYLWYETKGIKTPDFDYIAKDSFYIALDTIALSTRKQELLNTGLFSADFVDGLQKIGKLINGKLKSRSIEYRVGDLPPFGTDANPWTNTQDTPDNYWEVITISNVRIGTNSAAFSWTWGKDSRYLIQAKKESGTWKVSQMEGFSPENFIGT